MRKHLRAGLLGAVLAAVSPCTQGIQAGTIIVTSTDDSGPGSLREALALAETGDRIVFDASTAARPILLTSGQLILDTDVTIEGLGSSMTIVDGNASSRVFLVGNNVTATISNLTIRNGFEAHLTAEKLAVGEGGGIYNQGYLTVGNSVITHNTVSSLLCGSLIFSNPCTPVSIKGGGVFNIGSIRLDHCSITANLADAFPRSYGGAIYNNGHAEVQATTISENIGQADRYVGVNGLAIFNDTSGDVTIANSRITNNRNGATPAVHNLGVMDLIGSEVEGSGGIAGGGVYNGGTGRLLESIVAGNSSGTYGTVGGIMSTGSLLIDRSAVSGNSGVYYGGIYGSATIVNSTISGNDCYQRVGGVSGNGLIVGSTITGNSTYNGVSAGIEGQWQLKNSLVVGNYNPDLPEVPADCSGEMTSSGHNIVGEGSQCAGLVNGKNNDIVGADWKRFLEANSSSDNGGPTPTVALLPDSPAIDYIPVEFCTDFQDIPLSTDQRGIPRPQGPGCDVGAFEFAQPHERLFWTQQCREKKVAEYSPAQLAQFFAAIIERSTAFPECAPANCAAMDPDGPRNSWQAKAAHELLAVWLNLVSGRLTMGRPVDLQGLSAAVTVGAAVAEMEAAICNPGANRENLAHAEEIGEKLNDSGE